MTDDPHPRPISRRRFLERSAMADGLRTLWDDGVAKVSQGLTSLEELARVTI